jgi:hypothetical protein
MTDLYDTDFYAWANEQAALLRSGKLAAADIEHIAEEIESMGKTEKRELISRLTVLLVHLLKWQYQPVRRGSSWEVSIRVQRDAVNLHMDDNPSLKSKLAESIGHAYRAAALLASDETALPWSTFPAMCPWPFEQMMDLNFWPNHPIGT